MADFEVDISSWCDKVGTRITQFEMAFAYAMVAEIQSFTPVKTGRLRASIQVINPSAFGTTDPIVIGTNVEYALRIEYGFVGEDALGRRYNQKGAGMFTQAIARAQDIASRTVAAIGSG